MARIFPLTLALLLLPVVAGAAEREVTLSVDGMTCASCPYMVEQAPLQVERVAAASASMEDGSATVTFDDGVTDTESLVRAVERWGYGASLATVEGR